MAANSGKDDAITVKTAITWALTMGTVLAGIWQFSSQQAQSNRVPFLTEQLKLCFEASDTAARLATETDPTKWEEARKNFWRLYWGTLGIVEDRAVEAAMVKLGTIVPPEPGSYALRMKSLETPSLELAHATRDLILASWKVDLPPLQGRRQ